jgi:hypothetical protein
VEEEMTATGVKCLLLSQETDQPVEKVLVEFVEERMSLAEHQITLRR